MPAPELARAMLALQANGCHNINFVTPEHVVPQVLEALALAVEAGLRLPLVYNTSAYDSLESLALLDGIVDIYMPDLKLFDPVLAKGYLKAEDYPGVAKAAVKEMHRQVGYLETDERGLARRGVLIRHLVMPGLDGETRAILEWIAKELGTGTYVNVMAQYRPGGKVGAGSYPELNRPLSSSEYRAALEIAAELGLENLDARRR
jgi:putative pyruvate formate lyase activating enzyme